jgi:hypothetical protein
MRSRFFEIESEQERGSAPIVTKHTGPTSAMRAFAARANVGVYCVACCETDAAGNYLRTLAVYRRTGIERVE